jgi:integrase
MLHTGSDTPVPLCSSRLACPPTIVQQRLGHKRIEITLDIYAHVLPGQQRDAARKLATLLHG